MNTIKRVLAVVIALALCLCMIPAAVFAGLDDMPVDFIDDSPKDVATDTDISTPTDIGDDSPQPTSVPVDGIKSLSGKVSKDVFEIKDDKDNVMVLKEQINKTGSDDIKFDISKMEGVDGVKLGGDVLQLVAESNVALTVVNDGAFIAVNNMNIKAAAETNENVTVKVERESSRITLPERNEPSFDSLIMKDSIKIAAGVDVSVLDSKGEEIHETQAPDAIGIYVDNAPKTNMVMIHIPEGGEPEIMPSVTIRNVDKSDLSNMILQAEPNNNGNLSHKFAEYPDSFSGMPSVRKDGKLVFCADVNSKSPFIIVYDEAAENGECPMNEMCPLNNYYDTDNTGWYHDGIHFCLQYGLMNGIGSGKFDPNGVITRGMVVTMLYRFAGSPMTNGVCPFDDVTADDWFAYPVLWAKVEGIVNGMSETTFAPNEPITREQLATILYKYAQSKGKGFTGAWMFLLDYPDASKISSWADEAMHWCVMNKIINGTDGYLNPTDTATRAQAAAMFQRFSNALGQ